MTSVILTDAERKKLRSARKRLGLTLQQLGAAAELGSTTGSQHANASRIELSDRAISTEVLERVAAAVELQCEVHVKLTQRRNRSTKGQP